MRLEVDDDGVTRIAIDEAAHAPRRGGAAAVAGDGAASSDANAVDVALDFVDSGGGARLADAIAARLVGEVA